MSRSVRLLLAAVVSLSFLVGCDSGHDGVAVGERSTDFSNKKSAFPLRVEPGKRFLVDAGGEPFLITGDAAWSMIAQLTDVEIDRYLRDRESKGFNTLLVNLIEHLDARNAPNDIEGTPPFLVKDDFSTPNEAYFGRAARIVQRAADHGMLVLLAPAYMGYEGREAGWYVGMSRNGTDKLRDYGRYLARRFAAYPNIIWVHGGDFSPPEQVLLDAIANGIRDVDPTALQTFHGGRHTSARDYLRPEESWLTVNNVYTDAKTVAVDANIQYAKSGMPFFLIEGVYENTVDEATVRRQAYQALLSGASGQVMGNDPMWYFGTGWLRMGLFGSGWTSALDSGASISMLHLRKLFESHPWHTLIPGSTDGSAALAADKSFGIVYWSYGRGTVDLGRLSGPQVNARWYDPTDGSYTPVQGTPFASAGVHVFSNPHRNARGNKDWVLVLESTRG